MNRNRLVVFLGGIIFSIGLSISSIYAVRGDFVLNLTLNFLMVSTYIITHYLHSKDIIVEIKDEVKISEPDYHSLLTITSLMGTMGVLGGYIFVIGLQTLKLPILFIGIFIAVSSYGAAHWFIGNKLI